MTDRTLPPTGTIQIADVQAAFRWIRRELVQDGLAATEQDAAALDVRIADIETDVISFLTDRARVTRSA